MSLVKCKCGRYTNNGILCTSCQKSSSLDVVYYAPEEAEEEEELDELGFRIINDLEGYATEYDGEEDD
jgi:hypothetical protein